MKNNICYYVKASSINDAITCERIDIAFAAARPIYEAYYNDISKAPVWYDSFDYGEAVESELRVTVPTEHKCAVVCCYMVYSCYNAL